MIPIRLTGQKAGVKREIVALVDDENQQQLNIVKAFVSAAIDRLPPEVTAVQVKAVGFRDALTFQLMVKIEPVQLALDTQATPAK
jgi:hypothetical protein